MNNKKTLIILIVCTILIFILTKACSDMLMDKMRTDIENETINNRVDMESSTNKYVKKYKNDWEMLVNFFLMGKIGYDEINLSDKFIKKYPTIDSIVKGKGNGGIENDFFDNYNENMENILTFTCLTGNEKEEMAYQLHYIINENNELDDIEILDSKLWCDKKGDIIQYIRYVTYNQNPAAALFCLTIPIGSWDEDTVPYLTDKYMEKYKNYRTESIIPWKDWLYVDEGTIKEDENNDRIWYVEAVNTEEIRKYKIEFIIDEKGYVDDYKIEEIERREVVDKEEILDKYYEIYA